MQEYGVRANTLYEKNIRINSGEQRMNIVKRPYMLQVSKDRDGNISVDKRYIDESSKRVVKQI